MRKDDLLLSYFMQRKGDEVMITWVQAALLGLMSCTAASIAAALGTTIGNYTLNRPLIALIICRVDIG